MKYWEIVKSLTENPALSGKAGIDSIQYELYVNDSGTLQSSTYYSQLGAKGTSIGEAGNIDFDGWEIAKQPVTWQEAVQAWEEGNNVTVEFDSIGRTTKHAKGSETISLSRTEINEGTWYVED